MGFIAKHKNQATLFYHPEGYLGSQVLPYAKSSEKNIRIVDLSKQKLTGSHWVEIADGLKIPIKDLIDTGHTKFKALYKEENPELDEHGWISVLQKRPVTVRYPILILGDDFHWMDKPFRFVELIGNDSA